MFAKTGSESSGKLWVTMAMVAVVAAVPRFYWMITAQYNAVIIIFVLFALLPFVLLSKNARQQIGFRRISVRWILTAFIVGVVTSALVYLVGWLLFKDSQLNWYVVVMQTFNKDNLIAQVRLNPLLFIAFSLPVMIFSPLGEEFFFRGLLHETFARKFAPAIALAADALFFGVTHLAHYGLQNSNGITLLPSAFIWIALMSASAVVFYVVKQRSGSIWGAVLCHSGFNFSMMFIIFYVIN